MVRDHKAVNVQALDLVKKLKVTPEDNATSKALTKAGGGTGQTRQAQGAAFDKAYVDNEVAYHKRSTVRSKRCSSRRPSTPN